MSITAIVPVCEQPRAARTVDRGSNANQARHQVLLVDNIDNRWSAGAGEGAGARSLAMGRNANFSATAVNRGIRESSGDWTVLRDVEPRPITSKSWSAPMLDLYRKKSGW